MLLIKDDPKYHEQWPRLLVPYKRVHGIDAICTAGVDQGADAGRELASLFRQTSPGVWEMHLKNPIAKLTRGKLAVQVADHDRNVSRIERTFSIR